MERCDSYRRVRSYRATSCCSRPATWSRLTRVLARAPNLRVNEAALTGESVPVDKSAEATAPPTATRSRTSSTWCSRAPPLPTGARSAVVDGYRHGHGTRSIARLLEAHRAPATPLQHGLSVLGRTSPWSAVAICALSSCSGVLTRRAGDTNAPVAISLAVAAIPESLPAVVTISLALGAQRMARQHAHRAAAPCRRDARLGHRHLHRQDRHADPGTRCCVERVWTRRRRRCAGDRRRLRPTGQSTLSTPSRRRPSGARPCSRVGGAVQRRRARPATGRAARTVAGDPTEAALLALAREGRTRSERGCRRARRTSARCPFDCRPQADDHGPPRRRAGGVRAVTKGARKRCSTDARAISTPDGGGA